jgi:ubiquinone/menaquinone biosynthesis C-methylase UbiE
MMELPRPTELAHRLLKEAIAAGDVVVDATAGNGYDTLFLAEEVGEAGRVLAFDVQEQAVAAARERVEAAGLGGRVSFFVESHAELSQRTGAASVAAVMFNLGYLPGGDHARMTVPEETLRGLEGAAVVLRPGGVLSVVAYPGHPGGSGEAAAVEGWMARRAEEGWRVSRYGAVGTRRPAPFLLLAVKR